MKKELKVHLLSGKKTKFPGLKIGERERALKWAKQIAIN
jgi:hypothetical protein